MTAKRRTKAREAQLAFEALSIEGGLLSPEWLSKVAQLQAGTQAEADYQIPRGLNLRDEIGRYWRISQAHWAEFKIGREAKAGAMATSERFVLALLRDVFGFTALAPFQTPVLQEYAYPIGYATLGGRVPVVVAPADSGLDTLSPVFGDGSRRRSAFGLAQEYLNAQEGSLWGIASDGMSLRIVRDNASLTRPAWIEADLQRIFTEDRYSDFAALWLLGHETRFGREGQPVTDCALEAWRSAGREQGTRARESLRLGVKEALVALGQGFVAHAENAALRVELQNGTLPAKDFFNQLLRLVYRLIFLLTVEERGLLHPGGTSDATKALYANGYSIRRLGERSVKRSAHDRFADLWDATKVVCRSLAAGERRLGLPALAGIFASNQCPALDGAKLENRALLLAVFRLAWLREDGSLSRVNWRDMGPEELGSVYESLLELVPQITKDGRQFNFATSGVTKGNARKTTGSYYTPDSLVQVLLDSALEPIIAGAIAKNPGNAVGALLGLSIVDPACGSGHFLLAAARRLAAHVARQEANGTPSASEYRHALRQVVGRCIFGVDLNPMAVELCKVSLWMEAVEPGLPLTFLNSHIQHGNSFLGTTPELMGNGIPDAAWDPIEGDDKRSANALKKRNNKAAKGQRSFDTLWGKPIDTEAQAVTRAVAELDAASDANVEALAKKEKRWDGILGSPEYRHQKFIADAWCSAFVWPKRPGELTDAAPTNEVWRQLRDGQGKATALTTSTVEELAERYRFFHWHLQFPQVFVSGGFDIVLGNPPWERLKLQTEEWMTNLGIDLSEGTNASSRNALLSRLTSTDPDLNKLYLRDRRDADALDNFVRCSGRFPRTSVGDINSYALFAELGTSVLGPTGSGAWVLPLGIISDKTYAGLCTSLMEAQRLRSVWGFVNERQLFPDVLHNFKFVVFSVGSTRSYPRASFVFGLLDPRELSHALAERGYELAAEDVVVLNPDTLTCPVFLDGAMAKVLVGLHRRLPSISRAAWHVKPQAMLHMGAASKHFVTIPTEAANVPVYESKMVNRFNHRFASFETLDAGERSHMLPRSTREQLSSQSYEVTPGYFCPAAAIPQLSGPYVSWLLAFRRIANPALARTSAFCILPRVGMADSLSIVTPQADISAERWARDAALLCWLGNSATFDAVLKQKMGGNNFSEYVWRQLPVPAYGTLLQPLPWLAGLSVDAFVIPRVCELIVTSSTVVGFARNLGFGAQVFRWKEERRRILEAELDAGAAMAYGLARGDFEKLFDAFPVLRARETEAEGEFATRSVALAVYDAMADAMRTGSPWLTQLNPPPADSSIAHPGGLPAMPGVVPQLPPAEEAAIVIWSLLHAAEGTLTRTDLARAYALRGRPDLVRRFAPSSLLQASEWVAQVGMRSVVPGLFAGSLKALADRNGITLGVNSESRSTVSTSASTPEDVLLDPWFRFEARLVLEILRALPPNAFAVVDSCLVGDDSKLLDEARMVS
jgi:hypothetical protein